ATADEDQRNDRDPRHYAHAPGAALAEASVIVVSVLDLTAHATGSATVGPKAAGSVACEVSRSSDAETVNSPVTSRSATVSVTPMRSTGYPRPSHRPWNFTSSSRGTVTMTRPVDSENRADAASTPSRSMSSVSHTRAPMPKRMTPSASA